MCGRLFERKYGGDKLRFLQRWALFGRRRLGLFVLPRWFLPIIGRAIILHRLPDCQILRHRGCLKLRLVRVLRRLYLLCFDRVDVVRRGRSSFLQRQLLRLGVRPREPGLGKLWGGSVFERVV